MNDCIIINQNKRKIQIILFIINQLTNKMYNKEFLKYEKLKSQLQMIKNLCANQYFAVQKCQKKDGTSTCTKTHVDRCFYPCIYYYMGHCKYGFSCHFSHSIKRQITRPEPSKETCKKLYYQNYCPLGNTCKYSHDLRQYPCIFNSIGKCKFADGDCRYSHQIKLDAPIICFFTLMGGCSNQQCQNKHNTQNIIKYVSYEISLQSKQVVQPFNAIQKVKSKPCSLPYSAAVLIMCKLQTSSRRLTSQGTGAIIGKTTVLTVAHIFYNRDLQLQAFSCYIWVRTQNGLKKVKVKKWNISQYYKTASNVDKYRYDFAYLELEDNQIITQNHILSLKWKKLFNQKQPIEVIGFSKSQSKKFIMDHMKCECDQITENFIIFNIQIPKSGMSGGPIVVLEQEKFKLIGLHQAVERNSLISKGVLIPSLYKLISVGLSLSQGILNQAVPKNIQKDDEIKKLRQYNEKYNAQKLTMKILEEQYKKLIKNNKIFFQQLNDRKNKELKQKGDDLYKQAKKQKNYNNLNQALKLFKQCSQVRKLFPGRQTIQYADTILQIALLEYDIKNYNQALILNRQCLEIRQKISEIHSQNYATSLENIGFILGVKGYLDQAIKSFQQAIKIYKTGESQSRYINQVRTLQNIGLVFYHGRKYQQALNNYQQARNIYLKEIRKEGIRKDYNYANILFNIGEVYQQLGSDFRALAYYSQCAQIMNLINNQKHPKFQTMKNILQIIKKKVTSSQLQQLNQNNLIE